MNEVTATAVGDAYSAEQQNTTRTSTFRVRVVQHLITACPVRKGATLETLPTTQGVLIGMHLRERGEQKSFDLPVSKSFRAVQEKTPKRRSAEAAIEESIV